MVLHTLRLRKNGRHFTDNIFKYIFLNKNVWISIKLSFKFVLNGPIDNKSVLVSTAWCWTGDKPLSEPKMNQLYDAYVLQF